MQSLKQLIRTQVIAKCKEISQNDKINFEAFSLKHILPLLVNANSVAIYHAHAWEFNLQGIINYCLQNGKKLYQPVSYRESRQMLLMPYTSEQPKIFYPADYVPNEAIKWYNIDLILMPLVAVDALGYRLGKGGGYYDATLGSISELRAHLCGIGYACQIVGENLPHEDFDVKLDYFVSEDGLINFNGK